MTEMNNVPFLGSRAPIQVGMIVKDIEEGKKTWAAFLGMPVPPTEFGGDYSITKTEYMGQPAPDANCKLAFFRMKEIQIELIEPNEYPSTWRDFLEAHGGGLHHYGYAVEDIFKSMEDMKNAGYKLTQFGYYGNGKGAYAYYDCTEKMNCFIELLADF